ncbi:hypothetical protein ACFOKI_02965 [Sphingomonas qilianensis]|uniref:Uncharacterized protein n=1 Tax=Sphingomonas qilianensis TaxID=1736690 RepID=A0ABU9XVH5_9SPHN
MELDETGARQAVTAAEPQLRAALQDVIQRFGSTSIQIELPIEHSFTDDQQWSGNVYKYSF